MVAGTYNAHPLITAAGIATLNKLSSAEAGVYEHTQNRSEKLTRGLQEYFQNIAGRCILRGRARLFVCISWIMRRSTFMTWAMNHDFDFDKEYRLALIEKGIYHFPLPVKQGSISYAHSDADIDETLYKTSEVLKALSENKAKINP